MELAGEKQREALVSAGFDTFTRELSQRTENAWAFLSWLAFLDYEPIDFVKGEEVAALQRSLPRFAVTRFGGLTQAEIERLCACFRENPNQTATVADLESKGVDQGLLTRAARYGALIPDLLLSPSTYALCPGLHFCRGPAAP
jgi:phosphoserine phosphatase